MRELVASLPAKQREALQLRYFAGLDYAEIAAPWTARTGRAGECFPGDKKNQVDVVMFMKIEKLIGTIGGKPRRTGIMHCCVGPAAGSICAETVRRPDARGGHREIAVG